MDHSRELLDFSIIPLSFQGDTTFLRNLNQVRIEERMRETRAIRGDQGSKMGIIESSERDSADEGEQTVLDMWAGFPNSLSPRRGEKGVHRSQILPMLGSSIAWV